MKSVSIKSWIIGLALLLGAGLALAMKPTPKSPGDAPKVNLETLVPRQFGDWRIDEKVFPLVANPEQQAALDKIYNQILARTYVNSRGERIMLSIAYGSDQGDNMQVHKPEVCYPAQGFQVLETTKGTLPLVQSQQSIPVKRVVAKQGDRTEPITYWTTVGDKVAVDGLKWKLAQLKYGLTGSIPDGLLFRISSIDANEKRAFVLQERFVNDLVGALDAAGQVRLVGMLNKRNE